jgi:XTP/dITP diphosphohydrolase
MSHTEIVFATGNPHKVSEVAAVLPAHIRLKGLKDIGCLEDLPETTPTLEGNAVEKARYVHEHYGIDCFAEDTGLEIDALQGAPGVWSARYAGPQKDDAANRKRVLEQLSGVEERSARFRTVIALIWKGEVHLFEGTAEGNIAKEPAGEGGFGYDSIFIPSGETRTFAQMNPEEKNAISHRAKATALLVEFLHQAGSVAQ